MAAMSLWRPLTVEESQLEDFTVKGWLPPRVLVHWRALPWEHKEPQHEPCEIVSFLGSTSEALGIQRIRSCSVC